MNSNLRNLAPITAVFATAWSFATACAPDEVPSPQDAGTALPLPDCDVVLQTTARPGGIPPQAADDNHANSAGPNVEFETSVEIHLVAQIKFEETGQSDLTLPAHAVREGMIAHAHCIYDWLGPDECNCPGREQTVPAYRPSQDRYDRFAIFQFAKSRDDPNDINRALVNIIQSGHLDKWRDDTWTIKCTVNRLFKQQGKLDCAEVYRPPFYRFSVNINDQTTEADGGIR